MWIAKPLQLLTSSELRIWQSIEKEGPLSQTSQWAEAIEAVSGQCFLIFHPDEKVGGMVFGSSAPKQGWRYECINGPHLNWDRVDLIPRQLAVFATAVSRLNSPFESLHLRPRWFSENSKQRISYLPIELFNQTQAATWWVPIQANESQQFQQLSSRMKRTLTKSLNSHPNMLTQIEDLNETNLKAFLMNFEPFSKSRNFYSPPFLWFQGLLKKPKLSYPEAPKFKILTVTQGMDFRTRSITQLILCFFNKTTSYLFGYEKRDPDLPSQFSTSAVAHWEALRESSRVKMEVYDLNGYMIDAPSNHPYYGVCKFKEQFGGQAISYDIPELMIK